MISAGGTREPLDPVRYLGNRSSGKQGYALARTAVARGARVTLVEANTGLPDPSGADIVRVGTAKQLREAVLKAAADADVVVMAAAVADFRPAQYVTGKIKKKDGQEPAPLALVRNPDILAEVAADRAAPGQIVVGFAAETDDVLANGREKLRRKGCDLLVVNEVGSARPSARRRTRPWCSRPTGARPRCPTDPRKHSPTRSGISCRRVSGEFPVPPPRWADPLQYGHERPLVAALGQRRAAVPHVTDLPKGETCCPTAGADR